MKTKIKFKLWNPKTKKFINGYKEANKLSLGTANDPKDKTSLCIANAPDEYLTFCRFTGLLDKQGKEIYEGDICITYYQDTESDYIEEKTGIIKDGTEYNRSAFVLEYVSMGVMSFGNKELVEDIKVIGNIYENPELLSSNSADKKLSLSKINEPLKGKVTCMNTEDSRFEDAIRVYPEEVVKSTVKYLKEEWNKKYKPLPNDKPLSNERDQKVLEPHFFVEDDIMARKEKISYIEELQNLKDEFKKGNINWSN